MSSPYSDTHPKMEQMQIEFIRCMPSWKKIGIRQLNPNATPEQVQRMLAELMLGEELARNVFGEMKNAERTR